MSSSPVESERSVSDPDGCHWCGVGRRLHWQRWHSAVGRHGWASPSSQQRLDRMLQRRRTEIMITAVIGRKEIL